MFGEGIEAGIFVMIGGDKGRPVVFRTVDQLGREAGAHLTIGQLDRLGAACPDHVGHQFRLLRSKLTRISSPIGPSSTFCKWSMDRNRNGIASTFMAGTKVPISATLVRLRSMAPARVCSMVSFSSPSWRE